QILHRPPTSKIYPYRFNWNGHSPSPQPSPPGRGRRVFQRWRNIHHVVTFPDGHCWFPLLGGLGERGRVRASLTANCIVWDLCWAVRNILAPEFERKCFVSV